MGLASILQIYCDKCTTINNVRTSETHKTGTRGPLAYDNNSRAVFDYLEYREHTWGKSFQPLTYHHLVGACLKGREREIGNAVEEIAKKKLS